MGVSQVIKQLLFGGIAACMLNTTSWAGDQPEVEYFGYPDEAMQALPFSDSVRVGGLLFLSGQVGVDPKTDELVEGGIRAEARQTMNNIKASLERRGLGMDDLVKCTVMLADIEEWAVFNEVYREFFEARFPARSAFGADGLALGARVEVECIAAINGGS